MTESIESQIAPAAPPRVRAGPALIVLGIVGVIVVGGSLLALLPGRAGSISGSTDSTNSKATYAGIAAVGATRDLGSIQTNGSIPAGIETALVVPVGAKLDGSHNYDGGNGSFDRQINLTVSYAAKSVVTFYRDALKAQGWQLSGTQPSTSANGATGTETLAQRPASDGYYWQVGVTVIPQSESISPTLGGGTSSSGSSVVQLRVLQAPDAN